MKKVSSSTLLGKNLTVRGLSSNKFWDFENGFSWFAHQTRLNKMLAHYELYKSIVGLPGHVLELGVFKGTSLLRLAGFRNYLENDYSRKIVGFDTFGKFPDKNIKLKKDLDFIDYFAKDSGDGLSLDELKSILAKKDFKNIFLVKGNVFETLPSYLAKNPETKIAYLHLDMDVKEPTAFALEMLYDRVVPNGVIVLDDYNYIAGGTQAIDDFVKGKKLRIEKTSCHVPAFIRKP
ncbi:MAG: class I SAM-dependent methyltransferase [Nitrospinae bacterium]|nr:class I SAM-dependent methyltransferase [Nitrospinota bacterium]